MSNPLVEYIPPARNPGNEPGDVIELTLARPSASGIVRLTYDEASTLVADLYEAMTARNRHPAHAHNHTRRLGE